MLNSVIRQAIYHQRRTRGSALLVGASLALALSACGTVEHADETRGGRTSEPLVQSAAGELVPNGCGRPPDRRVRYVELSVAGKPRRFYVVPPSVAAERVPVLIGFHGRAGNGRLVAERWRVSDYGDGMLLGIYPDGVAQAWFSNRVGWDTHAEESDDLPFFDALVGWAKANYCIDEDRIHVVGHSWGGGMANLVACARSSVRSVVSVAGGGPTFPCRGPVAAMVVHGRKDDQEPIGSGLDTRAAWSFYSGCGTAEAPTLGGFCQQLQGCAPNYPVLWCEHGGGHAWPEELGGKLWTWMVEGQSLRRMEPPATLAGSPR